MYQTVAGKHQTVLSSFNRNCYHKNPKKHQCVPPCLHHKFNEFTLSANNKSRRLSTLSVFSLVLHGAVSILGCFILIRQQPMTRRDNRNQQKCTWKTWHMIYIPTTRPETFFQTFLLSWQRAPTLQLERLQVPGVHSHISACSCTSNPSKKLAFCFVNALKRFYFPADNETL